MDGKTLGSMPIYGDEKMLGITLRQHFAGLAMQGLLANPGGPVQYSPISGWKGPLSGTHDDAMEEACAWADSLLRVLAKEQQG